MPYNTNGDSHSEGVQNEKNVVDFLNAHNKEDPLNVEAVLDVEGPLTYEQRGGPREVADMVVKGVDGVVVCGVSMKKHRNGTFDYVNTSCLGEYLPQKVVVKDKEDLLKMREEHFGDDEKKEYTRKRVAETHNNMFKYMNSDNIAILLKAINKRNPTLVLVTDEREKKFKLYHESALRSWRIGLMSQGRRIR